MSFRVVPQPASEFEYLFGKSDEELAELGAQAYIADSKPGFPCRIALRDAEPGERLILINFEHQPANNPYRSAHAVFVLDGAVEATVQPDEVPELLHHRQLSVRAFDADDMMLDATVVEGADAAVCFNTMLSLPGSHYLHVHNAGRGCYLARVDKGNGRP